MQVRRLACDALGLTDTEVSRFVKAFAGVAVDHSVDVSGFIGVGTVG
jgi:hypothetical protein